MISIYDMLTYIQNMMSMMVKRIIYHHDNADDNTCPASSTFYNKAVPIVVLKR
jgi:hypothetical protein